MRAVFDEHRMGYWSAAFDTILEKHGWLDFETAEVDALDDPAALQGYDVVFVGWIPEGFWKESYLEAIERADGIVMLEGPLPEPLKALAGVRRVEGEEGFTQAVVNLSEKLARHPRPEGLWGNQPRLGP